MRLYILIWIGVFALTQQVTFGQNAPAWWTTQETLIWDGVTQENNSPANVGQLKHVALMAKKHLDETLGLTVSDWDSAFGGRESNPFRLGFLTPGHEDSRSEVYSAVNVGQLKAMSVGFYRILSTHTPYYDLSQHFSGLGLQPNDYSTIPFFVPWSTDQSEENFAPVNIGQLKLVFSFEVFVDSSDTDGDDLPDWWEIYHFGELSRDGFSDFDDDGLLDRYEWQMRSSPVCDDTQEAALRDEFTYDDRGWLKTYKMASSALRVFSADAEGNLTQHD